MPFLSQPELADYIGERLATQLVDDPGAFDAAERAAAAKIERITSVEAPEDAAEAPTWAKQPAAHLIAWALAGQISNWSEERLRWMREARSDALRDLHAEAAAREESPEDDTYGEVFPIEGMVSW